MEESGHSKVIAVAGREFELPFGDEDIAWAALLCSLGSIVFGTAGKAMQLLTVEIAGAADEHGSLQEPMVSRASLSNAVARLQAEGPEAIARLLQASNSVVVSGSEPEPVSIPEPEAY